MTHLDLAKNWRRNKMMVKILAYNRWWEIKKELQLQLQSDESTLV